MRNLINWEFKHLLQQKIIYITLMVIMGIVDLGHTVIDTTYKMAFDKSEGIITEQELKTAEENIKDFSSDYNVNSTILKAQQLQNYQTGIIRELHQILKNKNSGTNLKTMKEIEMRKNVDVMYLTYYFVAESIVNYLSNDGVIFIGILILAGIYSIFSRDATTGVSQYTLTSKLGRTKLVTAKIIVTLTYTIFVTIGMIVFTWIYQLYRASANLSYWKYAFEGWDAPIQFITGLSTSSYAISIALFHFVQLGFLLLGSIVLSILFLVVSSISKNSFISFLISLSILFLPILVVDILMADTQFAWINAIYPYTPTFIMKTQALFETFRGFHIGSNVILGPYVAIVVGILLIVGSLFYLKWYVGSKKVV